jgi:hypothetical protein
MVRPVTPFRFEHDFRAPSVAAIFEAYFDPVLCDEQDRRVEVARREVLADHDEATRRHRVCRVVPRRQLPAVVRPFVDGDLSYVEDLTWRKADDVIEMRIEPAVLGGRVEIAARYAVALVGEGVVRRTYDGSVSVDVRLLGRRIERGVIEDLGKTLVTAAACTQEWLDARRPGPQVILPG